MQPTSAAQPLPPAHPAKSARAEELALLLELSQTLAAGLELPQIYRQVVEAVSRTFGYAMVSVYTVEGDSLRMQHQVGYDTWLEQLPLGEGTMSRAVRSGQPVFIPNASLEPDFIYAVPGIVSMVAVPIHARGQVRGVLCVESLGVALSAEDCRLLEAVAFQVGGAVERGVLVASLLEQERLYRTLVETMPAAVVLYDGEECVYANPSALRTFGLDSLEELKRHSFSDFSQPGAPLSGERYTKVVQGEPIERAEDQLRNLRGEVIDLEVSAHPVEVGGRTLSLVTWQDITEAKQAKHQLQASEEWSRTILESISDAFFALDRDWRFTYLNREAERVLLRRKEELLGRSIWDEFPQAVDSPFHHQYHRAVRERVPVSFEEFYPPLDKWFEVSAYPSEAGLSVYFRDASERKQVEAALRRSEGLHRTLVQFSREIVEILDREGNLLYVSANVEGLGFDPEFWKSQRVNILTYVPKEYQSKARRLLAEVVGGARTVGPLVMPLRKFGTQKNLWFEVLLENRLDDPDIAGIVLRARDVTEQRVYQATIRHMAYHDELTALPNRRMFAERAEALLGQSAEGQQPCALLYLDLDQFKGVNDSLGHHAGDELLVGVAGRLRGCLRGGDLLARLGGDEMAVLLPATDETGAQQAAQRIRAALAEPFRLGGLEVVVTASIGIALFPQHGIALDPLMRAADAAMYAAKEGRDRWAVYRPDLNHTSRRQLELLQDLRQALKGNALSLVYQPIRPLRSGLKPKAEALLRWDHPARGAVLPGEFIPLAEAHGLAPALDAWVLERVIQEISPLPLEVCVNVSALTVLDPQSVEQLRCRIESGRFDPTRLRLEVTETALMRDFDTARSNLEALRQMGLGVALDDFGVGQTSLAHLGQLPVDTLKVDRSFVAGIGTPDGEALLKGILSLARRLGLATVAEGVETAEQLAWLEANRCDYAQGYFLGYPVSKEELSVETPCP